MKTSGDQLRTDIGNALRTEMKDSLAAFTNDLFAKLDKRFGEVNQKIAEVAAEKKAKGSGSHS